MVSHWQGQMVGLLLDYLKVAVKSGDIAVTLTLNIEEFLPFDPAAFPFPVRVVKNLVAQGFGANHNAAFLKYQEDAPYFCVVNPDIRLIQDPFSALLSCLQNASIGIVAPLVVSATGEMEDSARRFPTPLKIFCKVFGSCKGRDYLMKD